MPLASGRWAWWNQYGPVPVATCVRRAQEARLRGVIVKQGYPEARDAFAQAGVDWAVERYVYPDEPEAEARLLAGEIARGARFAVVDAEAEWEPLGPEPMQRLVAEFRRLQPDAELYGCVDTRGGRTALPYQRVLAERVAGWMPMIYPAAFGQPVREAFAAALDPSTGSGWPNGKPVMPAIQTYGGVGPTLVAEQIAEVRRRSVLSPTKGGLAGYQAYTIAHASDEEWAVIVRDGDFDGLSPGEDEMGAIDDLRRLQAVAGLFLQAAACALRGESLPDALRAQVRWLLGA
jgi:hypothetical protein